jgi:hypothetical protein
MAKAYIVYNDYYESGDVHCRTNERVFVGKNAKERANKWAQKNKGNFYEGLNVEEIELDKE